MSITKTIPLTPSPIIPVTDEQIKVLPGIPAAQQAKINIYNELLEEVYIRRTELEGLDDHLAAMKREIEDDIAYLAFKHAEEASLKAAKLNKIEKDGSVSPKSNANPNAAANVISAAIANLKYVAGTTKNVKSKGKGKGKQKLTKLNLDDDHYGYSGDDDYEYAEDEESEEDGEVSLIPTSFN
ncbi:hypothetical protein AGABI1DRAFT_116674 [Agaricus bisporus var. burnettii JB137-S8]|uniref:Uncharacterized protein n=2 Tax=Agaricus bisporus var. burnettii TaxID=192524 RepID=K5XK88_AGABU|nr:uncharacterized protein AGABI1DRAFT_116674 [Agaricus bisporus var. burnettii JB137-S8]EKM74925.1 hypothetical protein AGABI1DRAFT_116674 [Agaricus bisporus var. burnettii JB137-S8]KAF7759722.1 hypothetical protein Agabi119p4_11417 [Agaricus bisporus var. burnettii]